jgi:SAM-dependent methyltransferase
MQDDRPPAAVPGAEPWDGTTRELAAALHELVARLRDEQGQPLPEGEAFLQSPSSLRRRLKTLVFRTTRPATRRYDRLTADLATIAADLASRLAEAEEVLRKARGDYERLEVALRALSPSGTATSGSAAWTEIPDGYYWAFEQRMRGATGSIEERLRGYEDLVVPLREALAGPDEGDDRPRWVDLGCGQGEFCALLQEWGWDVEGVDASPDAIEACRARGIDVTLADVLAYLETRPDDPVGGVSAIQLIEHLPRRAWVHLFEEIHRALAPGGALLLETINGQNPDAIADYFVADVTHTWPGHPETLRLMAEHAGFERVEVRFRHEDHRGRAQDVAIWAVKAAS